MSINTTKNHGILQLFLRFRSSLPHPKPDDPLNAHDARAFRGSLEWLAPPPTNINNALSAKVKKIGSMMRAHKEGVQEPDLGGV